jgi:hypothetical protein
MDYTNADWNIENISIRLVERDRFFFALLKITDANDIEEAHDIANAALTTNRVPHAS